MTPDRKYSVFVSSTYKDLVEERAATSQALLELSCFPAGMELFPASDEAQWRLIERTIDMCDYYVLIVAGRYGSTTSEGVSFTEKEYDYAVSRGIPVLAFVHKDPGKIVSEKCESDRDMRSRLETFRMKVMNGRYVKQWLTAEELKGQVLSSLVSAFSTHPRTGWVRADQVADVEILREVNALRKQVEVLRRKEAVDTSAPEGAEKFAGGTEKYSVTGWVQHGVFESDRDRSKWSVELTWDQLFRYLGPSFEVPIDGNKAMADMGILYGLSKHKPDDDARLHSRGVYSNVAHQIMYQFQALGFTSKNSEGLWKLTPYGEFKLSSLLAIKRSSNSPKEPVPAKPTKKKAPTSA